MNFNTLSGSAKLYKKLEVCATGQPTPSGEVPNIAILCAVDYFANHQIVESVSSGIKAKGGLVTVTCVPDFGFLNKTNPMTAKYAASFARTSASTAEAIIRCGLYDGVVIVADCNITAAGLLEGASKANCPALIIPIGISHSAAKEVDNYKVQGMVSGGKINSREGEAITQNAKTFRGIPHEFNSVSTFFILMEAMGFCIPGASLSRFESAPHLRNAVSTGGQICENAKSVLSPKKFLTLANLCNAISLCLSIGADISAISLITNLVSIYEKVPLGIIAELSAKTALLVSPENQNCIYIAQVGGISSIIKQLYASKLIDDNTLVYTGEKLRTALNGWGWKYAELETVSNTARIILCKGSACENGGYTQPAPNTPVSISGKAWVYESLEEADIALVAGNIPDNSVIVVHNCPNTFVSALAYTIEGMGRQSKLAVITDGLCDKTSALVVTRCTPDSLSNESFANIQNGDQIDIDLGRGRLNTNILAKEMASREKKNSEKKPITYFM